MDGMVTWVGVFGQVRVVKNVMRDGVVVGMAWVLVAVGRVRMVLSTEISFERHVAVVGDGVDVVYKGPIGVVAVRQVINGALAWSQVWRCSVAALS